MKRNDDSPVAPSGPGLKTRLSHLLLKPAPDGPAPKPNKKQSLGEIEETYRYADDKERMIGLIAAPVAAAIAVILISAQISHDPAALLANGAPNPKHTATSLYEELLGVLGLMALGMLAFAWFRKRLYLGMVIALYGLAVFNLRYWGFGVPFVMVGAWYIVRAYRIQRDYKDAGGVPSGRPGPLARRSKPAVQAPPSAPIGAKRFTPPSSPRKRTSAVGR